MRYFFFFGIICLALGCSQKLSPDHSGNSASLKTPPCTRCGNFKNTGPAECRVGDEITYTIEVGAESAGQRVVIADKLPEGLVYLDSEPQPSDIQGKKIIWDIAADEVKTIRLSVQVVKPGIWFTTAVMTSQDRPPITSIAITSVPDPGR